jgi:hypothetical protein
MIIQPISGLDAHSKRRSKLFCGKNVSRAIWRSDNGMPRELAIMPRRGIVLASETSAHQDP